MHGVDTIQRNYLFILLGLTLFVVGLVFLPFLDVIVISAVIAVIANPLYQYLRKQFGDRRSLAAGCVVLLTVLFILIPLSVLVFGILSESQNLLQTLQSDQSNVLARITAFIEGPIQRIYPAFSFDLASAAREVFSWVTRNIGDIISRTLSVVLGALLTVITLFFFLRDGEQLIRGYIAYSPFDDRHDRRLLDSLKRSIGSVITGMLIIALIQGIVTAIGLVIFGVPSAVLWGTVSAISALVPGIGIGLVMVPAVLYVYITNSVGAAIGLAVWGIAIAGLVDNLLMPHFYGRGIHVHPLFVLFSVLGGLALFGAVGFIIGPLLLSILVALLEMYRESVVIPGQKQ